VGFRQLVRFPAAQLGGALEQQDPEFELREHPVELQLCHGWQMQAATNLDDLPLQVLCQPKPWRRLGRELELAEALVSLRGERRRAGCHRERPHHVLLRKLELFAVGMQREAHS
jgi:hypothetical protein